MNILDCPLARLTRRHLSAFTLALSCVIAAPAATYNVNTLSALTSALSSVQPGDSIVISGTINAGGTTLVTRRAGTAAAPITIRGTDNPLIKSSANYGIEILHDYYRLSDFRIEGTAGSVAGSPGKGVVITGAKHGVVDNVHVRYTDDEAFKVRYGSQYWLFTSCSARNTGLKKVQDNGAQGPYGEGFYVGNAAKKETNGTFTITDNSTRYVTFFKCYTLDTASDGWDVKEGSRFVKIINCTADFSGSVEPTSGALFGDNGFFLRGNDIQVVKSSVKGLANGEAGYSFANIFASNVDYGSNGNQLKQSAIVSGSGALVRSEGGTNARVFTDCQLGSTNLLYQSGSSSNSGITRPDPSTFTELTWSGIGGSAYANLNSVIGTTDPTLPAAVVATPVFTPPAGAYSGAQNISITTATAGASIRYTMDGSTPTATYGTAYTGEVLVSTTRTLKAIAYKTGMTNSPVATASYTITTTGSTTLMSAVFDSGTVGNAPGGWTITAAPNTKVTVEDVPSDADQSMRFTDTNTAGFAQAARTFPAQTGAVTLEFSFYASANWCRFFLQSGTTVGAEMYTKDGQLVYRNSAGVVVALTPFAANTWTSVKVVANASTDRFDVYVNGANVGTGLTFSNATSNLDTVVFGSGGSTTGTNYIDSVLVTK